ncbi:multidrug ABC transporter ATPase [Erysipelotrichaceae bacterium]|nr:multidrug ABC transporter ATPase [Erysipelotrichaceae bacterium]
MLELKMMSKRFYSYIKLHKIKFFVAIVFAIVGALLNALVPYLLGLAITEIQENIKIIAVGTIVSTINFNYILTIISYIVAVVLFGQTAVYLSSVFMTQVIQDTMKKIRTDVSEKLNRMPISYFDGHKQGDILSRITNDIDTVGNAMQQGFLVIITSVIGMVAAIIILIDISWVLAIIAGLIIPGSYFVSQFFTKKSQSYFDNLQVSLGKLNGYIQEDYSGFFVMKLYGQETKSEADFKAINHEIAEVGFKGNVLSAFIMPLSGFITNIAYLGIAVLGGYMTFSGALSVGNLVAACQYVWQINNPVSQITQLIPAGQILIASLKRIFEILDEPDEKLEYEQISLPEKLEGTVVFEHVKFGYYPENILIEDLSFEVKSGQTVAIVGPTGAGKTTLINLLLRFYEINSGVIKIDGISIQEMTREQLRSLFGMVLQDAWLYQTTISENIRLGKLNANEYEVVDSAKIANVHHFIKTLDEGYNELLNEETSNISQGQKQLLTIARAIISNPKILILDEATSSVDTRLEVLIQKAMKKIMQGRTSFVIAHRLSTIKEADLILVMKDGQIIEKGCHEDLLKKKGFYEKLYMSQFAENE